MDNDLARGTEGTSAVPEGWTRTGVPLDLVHPAREGVVPWRTAAGVDVVARLSGPYPRTHSAAWRLHLDHDPASTHVFADTLPPSVADREKVLSGWGYQPLPLNDGSPAGWDWQEFPGVSGALTATVPLTPVSGTDGPLRVFVQDLGRWWPQGADAGQEPTWVADGPPEDAPRVTHVLVWYFAELHGNPGVFPGWQLVSAEQWATMQGDDGSGPMLDSSIGIEATAAELAPYVAGLLGDGVEIVGLERAVYSVGPLDLPPDRVLPEGWAPSPGPWALPQYEITTRPAGAAR